MVICNISGYIFCKVVAVHNPDTVLALSGTGVTGIIQFFATCKRSQIRFRNWNNTGHVQNKKVIRQLIIPWFRAGNSMTIVPCFLNIIMIKSYGLDSVITVSISLYIREKGCSVNWRQNCMVHFMTTEYWAVLKAIAWLLLMLWSISNVTLFQEMRWLYHPELSCTIITLGS